MESCRIQFSFIHGYHCAYDSNAYTWYCSGLIFAAFLWVINMTQDREISGKSSRQFYLKIIWCFKNDFYVPWFSISFPSWRYFQHFILLYQESEEQPGKMKKADPIFQDLFNKLSPASLLNLASSWLKFNLNRSTVFIAGALIHIGSHMSFVVYLIKDDEMSATMLTLLGTVPSTRWPHCGIMFKGVVKVW